MSKSLTLVFNAESGKQLHLTFAKPQDNLNESTVREAMQKMVDSNTLLAGDGSKVNAVISAQYVERTVSKIF